MDKTKYKVDSANNIDLFTDCNAREGIDPDTGETVTIKPTEFYRAFFYIDSLIDDERYLDDDEAFIEHYGYSRYAEYADKYTIMTLTDVATGETDPWGVKALFCEQVAVWDENHEEIIDTTFVNYSHPVTIEKVITSYNRDFSWDLHFASESSEIKTWDTLKYYDDLFTPVEKAEPTPTPAPTATPKPTAAPVIETSEFGNVIRGFLTITLTKNVKHTPPHWTNPPIK